MQAALIVSRLAVCAIASAALLCAQPAYAQLETQTPPPEQVQPAPGVNVPGFWDPRRRPERPDLSRVTAIRFLTGFDHPPFNYTGPDGNPAGFNVDIARMICEEIRATCTIQMRRFDTLIEALEQNRGDAAIASIAATPEARQRADFTDPYYQTPARFVARKDLKIDQLKPETLEGKKVAVVAGTAHEAYLRKLFTDVDLRPYPTSEAARAALRAGAVDLLFGDGIALSFWLNGTDSAGCCAFLGGPFLEGRYFGEGVGIAVRRGNDALRMALNWALFRLWETGRFTDLWLRYFPLSPF
jgi:polar amino acid transport system substrate-binding protein